MENLPTAKLVEPLTIVIPAHNQAEQLRKHLPAILNQDYEDFEVVVVVIASSDDTVALLEAMEQRYKYLRHTSTPNSAHNISLERLALTLGIRGAQHEWVVVTQANAEPISKNWLYDIATTIRRHPKAELVLGFARYEKHSSNWFDLKIGFYRLWHAIANFDHVEACYPAVRGDGCNMAVRKSLFLSSSCFSETQNLSVGACELMANRLSNKYNTALCMDADAVVVEDKPTPHQWNQLRLAYCAIRRYQRHTFIYRLRNTVRLTWPWIALIFIIIPFIGGGIGLTLSLIHSDASYLHPLSPQNYAGQSPTETEIGFCCTLLTLILLSLIIVTTVRIREFKRTSDKLGCHKYYLSLIFFELMLSIWILSARIQFLFSNKNKFRKDFI
ncbi:MAG: glycosyltransferase [Bacteroidaceae bacterium]|nr:glycosyltransferase [Bacteroidaceae bacterium]